MPGDVAATSCVPGGARGSVEVSWFPGIAPELQAGLCVQAGARACWVNVPHLATDEYVRGMATVLRDALAAAPQVSERDVRSATWWCCVFGEECRVLGR